MINSNKPEIAYLIQNVLPILTSQYDFPSSEDEDKIKIDEIPVKMGSSIKKPDVVYYWNDYPVFLVEAKKPNKSIEDAVDQALSYIRNFPVDKFSKDGIRPRYFAVTIGRNIYFFIHRWINTFINICGICSKLYPSTKANLWPTTISWQCCI